ncbi:hypothetical protein MYCTH_2310716 [Thermothelomyces thermophilus ATCC 42464]|uniref:DUF7053 domain-containing protein n=1 Tax=Thermothelomyces thermophilus (strain ATCC 42464 / BCRC 31852 / DSM 1799) TaxID=573729 RepID=G2QLX1_THET4|nr:uncharacterized protein MYCTH_2310716 [Thermothelomyces thermophilus ATCC 42464]AEO60951.1 hypothetical protein MYCTH_2310716 [Thermothelomyces thermophilus ATCC 42464]
MLRKKDVFTVITPIPGFIPRQLAIDILHSHPEVITLNPLVIGHRPIPAPQNAETDEYYSTWYEITERIQFVPGIGRIGASVIKFNGCFHDMPWGLQTHIYAPMQVDLRNTYRIAGNQPGVEPPEIPEIGLRALGAPPDGLYLREDIEIRCNVTVMSFVKSQLKKAGGEMVRRMIKKAELLDTGLLQAMIEDGKLRTINPADRSSQLRSPLPSPTSLRYSSSVSGSPPPGSPPVPYRVPRIQSAHGGYQRPESAAGSRGDAYSIQSAPQELPADVESPPAQAPVEMPGDFYHRPPKPQQDRQSPPQTFGLSPPHSDRESFVNSAQHRSTSPSRPVGGQWTTPGSRPALPSPGLPSPGLDNSSYPAPLTTHRETEEEHEDDTQAPRRASQPPQSVPYNPADYAKAPQGQPRYGHGQLGQRYSYQQ